MSWSHDGVELIRILSYNNPNSNLTGTFDVFSNILIKIKRIKSSVSFSKIVAITDDKQMKFIFDIQHQFFALFLKSVNTREKGQWKCQIFSRKNGTGVLRAESRKMIESDLDLEKVEIYWSHSHEH